MYSVVPFDCETEFLSLCSSLDSYSSLISNEYETIKMAKLSILQQLKEYKYYFITWLREEHLTTEQVDKMLRNIFANVPDDFTKFKELEMSTLERCGGPLVEALLQIHVRRFGEAIKAVSKGEEFLEHCIKLEIIPREYYNGFKFLVSLLRLHLSVMDGSVIDSDYYNNSGILENGIMGFLKSDSDFEPLELAAVLSVKWQLNELFPRGSVDCIEDEGIEKIHNLDPENWVWSYLLYSRVRWTRRQKSGRLSHPEIREIGAISSAFKYAPTNYRPICTAGLVQCLAEILRWRTDNSVQEELVVGEMKFLSNGTIADFIIKTAKEALDPEKLHFGSLIRCGKIFLSILPREYRNVEITHKCLKATLSLMPTNSKANHQMGIFQFKHEKNRDLALECFVRAVKNGPKNFPAWLDMIQLLMSDLKNITNEKTLEQVFEDVLATSIKWATPGQRAALFFMRALHYFLKKENERAIEYWLMYSETQTGNSFPSFPCLKGMFKRYSFNLDSNKILENIEKVFSEKIKAYTEGAEKEAIKVLIKSVRAAVEVRTNMEAAQGENWRSDTNRSSEPIKLYQGRPRHPPSAADLDNSWRNSPRENIPQSHLSIRGNSGYSLRFQRTISPASNLTNGAKYSTRHSGSAWQQPQSSSPNNRSSPENWR